MINNKKVAIVIPAYNTEKTLEKTLMAIPVGAADEIIVVDDGSVDRTAEIARKNNVNLVQHEKNKGYGAAQKTGYRVALENGADIVVMVHSDFQYDPTLVPQMVQPIADGYADVCFGSRMHNKGSARAGGMVWWRFIANKALTLVEDSVFGLGLTEYHTGYRAYNRRMLKSTPFEKNSDNYVFDTEIFAQISLGNFQVAEIPIPTRYFEDSQSPNFRKSVEYGFMTLNVLIKYILQKFKIKSFPNFIINKQDNEQE